MTNRTVFPGHCDFTGYWVRSKSGRVIGQLERIGRNLHTDNTYHIIYKDVCGNGSFTAESLLESGATITLTKPEINYAPKPPPAQRRTIPRG